VCDLYFIVVRDVIIILPWNAIIHIMNVYGRTRRLNALNTLPQKTVLLHVVQSYTRGNLFQAINLSSKQISAHRAARHKMTYLC